MKRCVQNWRIWAAVGLVLVAAALVPVLANREVEQLTATPYADVIRFEAEGVATLQVRIFDLSGKEVWGSGVVSGGIVDWDRNNDFGERLAYGAYIYSAQGWNASGDLNFQKNGKLALMPGDKVQLQQAPTGASKFVEVVTPGSSDARVRPMAGGTACGCNEFSSPYQDVYVAGKVGIGTTSPDEELHVVGDIKIDGANKIILKPGIATSIERLDYFSGGTNKGISFLMLPNGTATNTKVSMGNQSSQADFGSMFFEASTNIAYISPQDVGSPTNPITTLSLGGGVTSSQNWNEVHIRGSSTKVGLGTTSPSANLDIVGSQSNLLRLANSANPTNAVFRVEKAGDVFADGAYYGAGYHTGGADVAERINTSEWVEQGDVVEIDPEHPGFFRKSRSPYSTRVAGIISTAPGIVLGNTFDMEANKWGDSRPVLAIAGRVPVKVSTENGPIGIGDLLVSASKPGYAMRCSNPREATGMVIGKAMELLLEGEGIIMSQVMLR